MTKKILVVEDEPSIVKLIEFNLVKEGFLVDSASDGEVALEKVKQELPDLIILDLMLPRLDGLEVCRQVRQSKVHVPILMLTAKSDEFNKVLGLELGADDYLTKPFSVRELTARIKAIFRRMKAIRSEETVSQESQKVRLGDLLIDIDGYEVTRNDERIDLTPKEFELLMYLVNHRGKVLSREQLLSAVWNYDFVGDSRIVDVHVSHLRDKVELDSKKPIFIKTVRGVGYKFEIPS